MSLEFPYAARDEPTSWDHGRKMKSELEAVATQRSVASGQGYLQTRSPGREGLGDHRVKASFKCRAETGTALLPETGPLHRLPGGFPIGGEFICLSGQPLRHLILIALH